MKRVTALLITLALIGGMVGCPAAPVEVELEILSTSGGSVTAPGEGTFTYEGGKVVELVAVPDECYRFVNWTGDTVANPESATATIIMDAARSVTANFAPRQYDLTIGSTDGGSVIVPGEGTFSYDCGTVVELVAEAEEGHRFVSWTGDVSTVASVAAARTTIIMNGDYSITAGCVIVHSLTIASTVGGSVTAPGEGAFQYGAGRVVNLVATADSGYHFVNWTGDVTAIADVTAAMTSVTMHSDYVIAANFAADVYFAVDAHVALSGPATLPLEARNPRVLLHVVTNMVVHSVRVDLPDGGSVILPRFTDAYSPGVDWTTLYRFLGWEPGMPRAGAEYTFTGLDEAGEPVLGARDTDIWVGVEPPHPPTNLRAELVEDGILVSWDEGPMILGSFEPTAVPQLGFYLLSIRRVGTWESVYGATSISASPHIIPRNRRSFVEGKDFGLSLSEIKDGTYLLLPQVISKAPLVSLGKGAEYNNDGLGITVTIQGGRISIG